MLEGGSLFCCFTRFHRRGGRKKEKEGREKKEIRSSRMKHLPWTLKLDVSIRYRLAGFRNFGQRSDDEATLPTFLIVL